PPAHAVSSFTSPAPPHPSPLSLHDALPISAGAFYRHQSVTAPGQPAGKLHRFLLLFVRHSEQDGTVVFHFKTACDKPFEERLVQTHILPHHLTGRFHFRPECDVHVFQLAETEHRSFDVIAFLELCKSRLESGFFDFHPEDGFHCKVCHRDFSNLAHERHRTARSRIDFEYIDFTIREDELYVDQPDRIQP